jgi:hypothetical protein
LRKQVIVIYLAADPVASEKKNTHRLLLTWGYSEFKNYKPAAIAEDNSRQPSRRVSGLSDYRVA